MKGLYFSISALMLMSSCNMISQVQRSTHAIQENEQAVTAATYGIEQNRYTVERSSVAIESNLEVVQASTERIKDNADAVETSTAVIRRNAEVVERSTELLGKLHVDPSIAHIILLGLVFLLFGMPIAIAMYLSQINRKIGKFMKEYKKNSLM